LGWSPDAADRFDAVAKWLAAGHWIGSVLVTLQFALLAVLAWLAAPVLLAGATSVAVWLLLVSSAAVGLWALAANRPGNFNIRPAPRAGGALVAHGPYRWIRHPMYSAVITFGLACACSGATPWAWLSFGALVAVLVVKAAYEERWMLEVHPGYAAYRQRTRRFLPGCHRPA
jgi:protein-S-isoprenylcysteine O-methyltransferase Ste14